MRQLLATLRHRPAPLVGTFVALFAAATIVTWSFSLGESGNTSTLPAERLADASVVVVGNPDVVITTGKGPAAWTDRFALSSYRGLPASLATMLRGVPGVRAAAADQSVPVALELSSGRIVTGSSVEPITAYGWQSALLTPFVLESGHAPLGDHQLVIGAGLAQNAGLHLDDRVRLVGEPLSSFTIVGIADAPRGNPAGDWTAFLSNGDAASLSGHPDQADLIGIVAKQGTSASALAARVRAVVAGRDLSVLTGSARGSVENLTAASDLADLPALGGTAVIFVFVALFVVASTVALSVSERARSMALLRAVGATPGQVRRMVMAELAALGVAAGAFGYLPGLWIASLSVHGLIAHQIAPPSTRPWTSPYGLIPAIAAGFVIAELAGLLSARRASRMRPAAALAEASVERRYPRPLRLILGLGAIGGGVVASVIALNQPDASQQLNQAQDVLLAFMAGVALLGPYLMSLAEMALRLPLRLLGRTPGRVASAQIKARSRRMAAAAVAIALPITFMGAISTIDATQVHGSITESRTRLAASAVVTAPGPGLDPSVLTAIRRLPDVDATIGLIPTAVYAPPGWQSESAEAVTPGALTSLLHLAVTSGGLAHFGPDDIALSALIAGKGGVGAHVGETITTYLADGTPYRAKVTAIFARSLGFADVLVPAHAAGGGHLGASTLGEVLVGSPRGTDPNTLSRQLESRASTFPGLEAASRSVANAQYELADEQTSYMNNLLLALIGLLAAAALVNTLVMTTLQGREELNLLRRVGATARQLVAVMTWEVVEVVVVGVLLGAGAAVPAVVAVSNALTGTRRPFIPGMTVALIIGVVGVLAALAVFIPTTRMLTMQEET